MDKCYIILVDMVNCSKFSSKNVRNTLNEVIISDSSFFNTKKDDYLQSNTEILELNAKGDKMVIEKAMHKRHLFINIIRAASLTLTNSGDIYGAGKLKSTNEQVESISFRHLKLLKHAFLSKARNVLYLVLNDSDCSADDDFFQNWMEADVIGEKTAICIDQVVRIIPGIPYDKLIQLWLLRKLSAFDGNFPFFCLPILGQLLSITPNLVFLKSSQLSISAYENCDLPPVKRYHDLLSNRLASAKPASVDDSYRVPIYLYADQFVDWVVVKSCVHERFSDEGFMFLHYQSGIDQICQNIDFFLVTLLRYFKIFPQDNQLQFTTCQMATLVNDILRDKSLLPEKSLLIFVENIDWIIPSCTVGQACSWLPEKCAPNIQIVLTASKDSVQEKSLRSRLTSPIFIDVSFPTSLISPNNDVVNCQCSCSQLWCVVKLCKSPSLIRKLIHSTTDGDTKKTMIRLLTVFATSFACCLSQTAINWILSFPFSRRPSEIDDEFSEKSEIEVSEKETMNGTNCSLFEPVMQGRSQIVSDCIDQLLSQSIITSTHRSLKEETYYSLSVHQLKSFIRDILPDFIDSKTVDIIQCRIGAYFVYHCTDFQLQFMYVPIHLQYLPGIKNSVLKDWLLNWPVLMKMKDDYSVPVRLLLLWRSILGANTNYKSMVNAYITAFLSKRNDQGDCCSCRRVDNVELTTNDISLKSFHILSYDCPRAIAKQHCVVFLQIARLAMQVGQYVIAKEMARVLLKRLDRSNEEGNVWMDVGSNPNILASCLHLLFCTLDERLKTYEFVTELTTPIFRRTVHYGSRALMLQTVIVEGFQKKLQNSLSGGSGDKRLSNTSKYQQKLCQEEIRLARIMTHFVFALDGVEQTVINQYFTPSEIHSVSNFCMVRAHEIAQRLRDRHLLLEILMTFGVIQPRENFKEKILLYKTPLRQALCIYGEAHIFVSRLYINIGISYEEQKNYIKAFEYFTLWSHVTHELLGRQHCKSTRSCGVFKEPIFKATAEFCRNMNEEEPSEILEDELRDYIYNVDAENVRESVGDFVVEGTAIGSTVGDRDNLSYENAIHMRNSMENETDWEIHSSDDETPTFTTAFTSVIDMFRKKGSSVGIGKDLLKFMLDESLIDSEDLTKEDIKYLFRKQSETDIDQSYENDGAEDGISITRMQRDLQDLFLMIQGLSMSPSDMSLSRRLLQMQRELNDLLNN